MKFVDITYDIDTEGAMRFLSDNDTVNKGVNFDEGRGIPHMRIKRKENGKFKMTCEFIGGPTKDNGFLVGTYFSGRATEVDGKTRVKGIITTAPIYHAILLLFIGLFVFQCIRVGGFSVAPPIIIAFDIVLFWKEFKKQGYIERYLRRASRRVRER